MHAHHSNYYRIEPLNGHENYVTWRIQIMDILSDLNLWQYTSGTNPRPSDIGGAQFWAVMDRKALTTIRLRVSNAMMVHIITATTSKEAFDAFSNIFATAGSIAAVTSRRRLFRYSIEEGQDIEEHIGNIKRLWTELVLSATLSDHDLAMVILTALPPSWDSFISSVQINSTLLSADIIGRILQENMRRSDRPAATFLARTRA